MNAESDRINLQRRHFDYCLKVNYQLLTKSLEATSGISFVFDVHTPNQEPFYVAAYQVINPENSEVDRLDDIVLLAIEPQQGRMVGFSFNGVSHAQRGPLAIDGVIATTENGKYYGYGLEAARQFIFGEVADYEQRKLEYRIKEQFPSKVKRRDIFRATFLGDEEAKAKIERETSRRAVWEHFYGASGIFGYDKKGRRRYSPTRASSDSLLSQQIPQGLVMSIVKEGVNSSYVINRDNGILGASASLGIQDKTILLQRLRQLRER